MNNNLALQVKNATFAWEELAVDLRRRRTPTKQTASKSDKGKGKFFKGLTCLLFQLYKIQ